MMLDMSILRIFKSFPELVVGFSTVRDGNMGYKWGDTATVEASRRAFCSKIGIDIQDVVCVNLVHGTEIIRPTTNDAGKGMLSANTGSFEADGLTANTSGLGLCFVVADCMPVILYDSKNRAIAVLHAGRLGVEQNILQVGLEHMTKHYNTKPQDVYIGVGPSIDSKSYVFDTDAGVDKAFWGRYFARGTDGKYHMDNKGKLLSQAIELGVSPQQIEISDIDTYTSSSFYSHRRSQGSGSPEGRFAVVAYLKQKI